MVDIIQGDLLESREQFLAHQCNCITTHAAGTARAIFRRFPYADIYKDRKNKLVDTLSDLKLLGTITVRGDGIKQRYVINMLAQLYPGKPKYQYSRKDGIKARENYFHNCLMKILRLPDLKSIAFPYGIGCNLAGGDWNKYLKMIEEFEFLTDCNVKIYRLP